MRSFSADTDELPHQVPTALPEERRLEPAILTRSEGDASRVEDHACSPDDALSTLSARWIPAVNATWRGDRANTM